MKPYNELNTVELVEANLAGQYGDITIDPETVLHNLVRLKPMLADVIKRDAAAMQSVRAFSADVPDSDTQKFLDDGEHTVDLMAEVEMRLSEAGIE